MWADAVFTLGGGVLLTISGILLAMRLELRVMDTPWLLKGIVALGCATLRVARRSCCRSRSGSSAIARRTEPGLRRTFLQWSIIGWADTALLFYGLWAMVTKR